MSAHFRDASDAQRAVSRVADRFGEWTAHNLEVHPGVETFGPSIGDNNNDFRLHRVVQTVADLAGRPVSELRILDLGCLEGLFAVEFARQGAEVVGIEGRVANLAKAEFARDALGLERLEFHVADVRDISVERYGFFDVVLVLGVLYHLDFPDNVDLLSRVGQSCTRMAIIDTEIEVGDGKLRQHHGSTYRGSRYVEPRGHPQLSATTLWSSLRNEDSFILTRDSLVDALGHAGFTTVLVSLYPHELEERRSRATFVAMKGQDVHLTVNPFVRRIAARTPPKSADGLP